MKTKGFPFFKTFISLLLLVFLIHQTYAMLYKPITTATATHFSTYEGIDITGYFVRAEQVIDYTSTGAERYVVGDGEKVAKGGTVAEVYSNASTVADYVRIEELENQISTLESINSVSDPSSVDLDTLNNKINKAYIELISSSNNGCFANSSESSTELLTLLNKKQVLTAEVAGFDSLLASLKAELSSLKAGLAAPLKKVTASASGYFVSSTDGLEALLDIDNIDNFDEASYEKIATAEPTEGFGKIISDYNWYIVTKMEDDQYLNLTVGNKITLKTTIAGSEELSARVYKVNASEDKNTAIVIFSCSTMNGQLAATRSTPMTIITKSYEGIRVSNKSVRVVDGQSGVYIVQGSIVKFRPIDVIYTHNNYVLCKENDAALSSSLRLYDEVIEKGKNLYDGKYIG